MARTTILRWMLIVAANLGIVFAGRWASCEQTETVDVPSFRIDGDTCVLLHGGDPVLEFALSSRVPDGRPAESVSVGRLGRGRGVRVTGEHGDETLVAKIDGFPFLVVLRTLKNPGEKVRVIAKETLLKGRACGSWCAGGTVTMSTAGLIDPEDSPAGYAFMTIADPKSRRGMVIGWLTHERGSGIVSAAGRNNVPECTAHIDYGDLRIPPKSETETEILLVGFFDDVRLGLEQYAEAIAQYDDIHLPPPPTVYCTWYHARASNEKDIVRNAEFAREKLAPYGFQVMQIDDGWQAGESKNGPRKNFSTHRPDGPFPSGMKHTADAVKARGLLPGIWFMPFSGTWNDPYWQDKLHLFYREGRSPYNHIAQTNGGTRPDFPPGEAPFVARWGGTCLDMTNPEAQEYLRSIVARIAGEWGYRYFKMDGLWTGTGTRLQYVNSAYQDDDLGLTKRHNPAMTPIEAYRKGLAIVRETAGDDVFLLGCCAPQNMRSFGPAFGMVDAMRVGPDNGANPKGLIRGPLFSTRVFFLNKRVWYNDPDPVYVRPSFPKEMAETSVSWTALTGSLHSSSYQYDQLPPDRLRMLTRSMPSQPLKTVRPVDYLENDPARLWLLCDNRGERPRYVLGVFNWDIESAQHIAYPISRIGLPADERYVAYDFWRDRVVELDGDEVSVDLPPGGCAILAIRRETDYPQVLSTSRHVTQGVIDLRDEHWDTEHAVLSGVSDVPIGDPYEIRIVLPSNEDFNQAEFRCTNATEIEMRRDDRLLRIRWTPLREEPCRWQVSWKRD